MGRGKSQKSLNLIDAAKDILAEIQPATIRGLCYQLFNRGLIDSMAKKHTNRVSELLTAAREDGTIPWSWVVQEGRAIEEVPTWRDPAAFARVIMGAYRKDKWAAQPRRIIVVSEKGTCRGVLAPVLDAYEVDFLPVGGFSSSTRVYELAQSATPDRPLLLIYLGDFDPSGMGMSVQDLPRRLLSYSTAADAPSREEVRGWTETTVEYCLLEAGLVFRRITLTESDCDHIGHELSFPASDKRHDTRYPWFVRQYGDQCWELDSMNPNDLRARVETAIRAEIDPVAWNRYVHAEEVERASIETTLTAWNSISGLAPEYGVHP
jgi:hypothetical protein